MHIAEATNTIANSMIRLYVDPIYSVYKHFRYVLNEIVYNYDHHVHITMILSQIQSDTTD